MAGFRKLFLALAAVTVFTVTASAQTFPALQCVAQASVPPTVRAEGLTELVGDVTISCTGGTPTQVGATVPSSTITVFLNTNITSRILSTSGANWMEAIILIDEPHSTSNPTVPLLACGDAGAPDLAANPGVCLVAGTGSGAGVYNGTAGRPNVFQGRQNGVNSVIWPGLPIDAPGTTPARVLRITNVRANANQLGVSSSLVPTQIYMYISVTGSNQLPLTNPTQTVAFVAPGLTSTVIGARTFQQCISNNTNVANGSSYSGAVADFAVRLREGFPSSFKRKNWGYSATQAIEQNQNVPGGVYVTESGFENIGPGADPSPNPPTGVNAGIGSVPSTNAFPAYHGLVGAGQANSGTHLMLNFANVPAGTVVAVPTGVVLKSQTSGATTGVAYLVSTDSNGAGTSLVSSLSSGAIVGCSSAITNSISCPVSTGLALVSVTNGTGIAVYEVYSSDKDNTEQIYVPVVVGYVANTGSNLPAPYLQSNVTASFAPLSSVTTADANAPIPRFANSSSNINSFIVTKCTCNLLFPFVTNQLGYDTGIAISNTSLDTGTGFGTGAQSGIITLNYYCGQPGCTSPPQGITNAVIPAGQQLTFTLFGGGGYGIPATPGFQGYIIAQAQFQYCHAYAFISAQGGLPTQAGANTGYVALEIDSALPSRTGAVSEVAGH